MRYLDDVVIEDDVKKRSPKQNANYLVGVHNLIKRENALFSRFTRSCDFKLAPDTSRSSEPICVATKPSCRGFMF